MYKVHGYLGGKRVINWRMQHLPRLGDEVRISDDKYGVVKQVVWCMDEDDKEGQRVNLRIESINIDITAQENELANKDAESFGIGFLVDGLRVDPSKVVIINPSTKSSV